MESAYQALVAVEPTTLIVTILNLFLQIFLIKKFLLGKVLAVLERRRQDADKEITDATLTRQEAQTLKETYEANLHQAKQEAGDLIARAQKTAADRSEEIIRSAQEQVVQMKRNASAQIAQEKKKTLNDAKDEIAGIAMQIAGKVVGRSLDGDDQSRLVDEFIDELGDGV